MSHPKTTLSLRLHRAYATLRFQLDEELGSHHGIDFDDFALLHCLASSQDESASLAVLATELGASRSTLLRRLRPLEKIGLIAPQGGVLDRRVALRSAGLSLVKTAQDTAEHVCTKTLTSPFMIGAVEQLGRAILKS